MWFVCVFISFFDYHHNTLASARLFAEGKELETGQRECDADSELNTVA